MTTSEIIRQGSRVFHYATCTKEQRRTGTCGCGDSWVDWIVFDGSLSDDEILVVLDKMGCSVEGCYRGPGRAFARGVSIRRSVSRVLVTQTGGLDV